MVDLDDLDDFHSSQLRNTLVRWIVRLEVLTPCMACQRGASSPDDYQPSLMLLEVQFNLHVIISFYCLFKK